MKPTILPRIATVLFGTFLLINQKVFAYELSCGQWVDDAAMHARIFIASGSLNVDWEGFVSDAPWFAVDIFKTQHLPVAYLNPQFAVYKVNFSVPTKGSNVVDWHFNPSQPEVFEARATTPDGDYASIPVVAQVTFMLNTIGKAEYSVPIEFLSLAHERRWVTTTSALGGSSTSDDYVVIHLTSGDLKLREACTGTP